MDYAVEHGVIRNFEPWRQNEEKFQAALTKRAEEEKYDAVRALENRTLDSKRQMDQLDALEELKAIRAHQSAFSPDDLIEFLAQKGRDLGGMTDDGPGGSYTGEASGSVGVARRTGITAEALAAAEQEDAAAANEAFLKRRSVAVADTAGIKRLRDEDDTSSGIFPAQLSKGVSLPLFQRPAISQRGTGINAYGAAKAFAGPTACLRVTGAAPSHSPPPAPALLAADCVIQRETNETSSTAARVTSERAAAPSAGDTVQREHAPPAGLGLVDDYSDADSDTD